MKSHILDFRVILLSTLEASQDLLHALLPRDRVFGWFMYIEGKTDEFGGIQGVESNNATAGVWKQVGAVSKFQSNDRFRLRIEGSMTAGTTTGFRSRFSINCRSEKGLLFVSIRVQSFQDSSQTEWFQQRELGGSQRVRHSHEL